MVKRFDEVLDKNILTQIANSKLDKDWSTVGWRGVMFKNGLVWVDYDGKVRSVNYITAKEKQERAALIASQKAHLYPALRHFKDPMLKWKTKHYLVRIDRMPDGSYRYAAWVAEQTDSDKPKLVLLHGHMEADGNAGNGQYVFKNGKYTYICYENVIGPKDMPLGQLEVQLGNKTILSEDFIFFFY